MKYILFVILSCGILLPCSAKQSNSFMKWKRSFIKKCAKKGLPEKFVQKQLKDVFFKPKIIKKDRNQISHNTSINYNKWIKNWLSGKPDRIKQGKELLNKYSKELRVIEKIYKVDKEIIISLWGVESKYGKYTGKYDVISSLTSLAYDKRRRSFFENELYSALKIIHQKHIPRKKMLGSWAGAIGQCQFMPSSFIRYAQDFDFDGKKDVWNNPLDIMASIANYLKHAKWKKGLSIGQLKKPIFKETRSPAKRFELGNYDNKNENFAIIPFKNSPMIFKGSNYTPLMKWNKSTLFAALNILLMEGFKKIKKKP